jgi:hypothetical protein
VQQIKTKFFETLPTEHLEINILVPVLHKDARVYLN